MGVGGGAPFWDAVRANLESVAQAREWWTVVAGPVTPVIEDAAFLAEAIATLPLEPFDAATWTHWTTALKARTGAKGKALFMPLRLALTGRGHGPELASLLPVMGREKALARLRGHVV